MANDPKDQDRTENKVFGDMEPNPGTQDHIPDSGERNSDEDESSAMYGGSNEDRVKHSGSKSVTEGVTGGLGTETGGTRNYRQGTGATGGDIGNRPE
jgi:hypothetical protein